MVRRDGRGRRGCCPTKAEPAGLLRREVLLVLLLRRLLLVVARVLRILLLLLRLLRLLLEAGVLGFEAREAEVGVLLEDVGEALGGG